MIEIFALLLYFGTVLAIGAYSYRRVTTSADFILGDRSLNYVLTAMAAHASDMSSWLFMGYPAIIFTAGLFNAWLAVGLLIFMWINWTYVAPAIRSLTEKLQCSTLPLFFEKKLEDHTGTIRIISSILYFIFYSVYLCAGLVGLGVLGESLFGLDYIWGISLAISIVFLYLFFGGYIALAWLDLFQGSFLLLVILFIPIYIGNKIGGVEAIENLMRSKPSAFMLVPDSGNGIFLILSMILGWGLGYFGQPHILTKFMGICHPNQMHKSRNIGMAWMTLALIGATAVGVVGMAYFSNGIADPETLFIYMVKETLHPFFAILILCAIIAATINVMSSQLLVMSSTLSEDLLGGWFERKYPGKNKLWLSRGCVLIVSLAAFAIACMKFSSVFSLVKYAWSGLGASFGPLMLLLLYTKNVTRQGAIAGMIAGGLTTAFWPVFDRLLPFSIDPMVPGYLLGGISILVVSRLSLRRTADKVVS